MELAITKNKEDLEKLESVIQRNLQSVYEVGRALMEIRDNRLYEKVRGIATFETYCKTRWDFSRQRAYQLIESVEVKDNLSTPVDITEFQIRPLARLEPEQQREAWQQAVDTAPDGKVTAAHVRKVVNEMKQKEDGTKETQQQEATEARQFVTMAISQLERIRKDDPCREKELTRIFNWIIKNRKG